MTVESIVFNGITFRRYPNSSKRTDRVYYCPGSGERARGVQRLHEEIWKAHNGPIPQGCHIHHTDGNPLNNELANLACIPATQHRELHLKALSARSRSPENVAFLKRIQPLSAAWHRTSEGQAWHKENGKRAWARRQPVSRVCDYCGKTYMSLARRKSDRFCSKRCLSAERRQAGIDNESRMCANCGLPFLANKYKRTRTCSRTCAWVLRRLNGKTVSPTSS